MVICLQNHEGSCSTAGDDFVNMNLRIIDFGSAIDDFSRSNLYGRNGPSRAEQTWAYLPPEALLDDSWIRGSLVSTSKYDTWTVGQVILELILGMLIVFHIDRAPTTIKYWTGLFSEKRELMGMGGVGKKKHRIKV